jgi:hypothetical protein
MKLKINKNGKKSEVWRILKFKARGCKTRFVKEKDSNEKELAAKSLLPVWCCN